MTKIEFIESYIKHGGDDYEWSDNHGELIRCKNCKYWESGKCWNIKGLNKTDGIVEADNYCSYAEKR